MEELRITSDDLDQAMCIIENYKILKLEKFEQGKLSKLVFLVTSVWGILTLTPKVCSAQAILCSARWRDPLKELTICAEHELRTEHKLVVEHFSAEQTSSHQSRLTDGLRNESPPKRALHDKCIKCKS